MISDSQKLMIVTNLLSSCIKKNCDLNIIDEHAIKKAVDIAEAIIDIIDDEDKQKIDITDNEKIIDVVSQAFDSINSVSSQKELLIETIQQKEKISRYKANAVIQQAEKIGLIATKRVNGKNFYILVC